MLIKFDSNGVKAIPRGRYLEKEIEVAIEKAPGAFLGLDILLIGRQVRTDRGIIDLLGLDRDGNTVIIELKRYDSPREIVSQAISYRSFFRRKANLEHLNGIAEAYFGQNSGDGLLIKTKFKEKFGSALRELNKKQIIVLVAEHFPDDVLNDLEEISDHVCVEYSYFKSDVGEEYVAIRKASGPEPALDRVIEKKAFLREYDPFFDQAIIRVKEILPKSLSGFKTTWAHEPTSQWIRFHWRTKNVHIGLWAERDKGQDQITVYFFNGPIDQEICKILKSNELAIRQKLRLKDDAISFSPNNKDPFEIPIGDPRKFNPAEFSEKSAQTIADFISILKPIMGDRL